MLNLVPILIQWKIARQSRNRFGNPLISFLANKKMEILFYIEFQAHNKDIPKETAEVPPFSVLIWMILPELQRWNDSFPNWEVVSYHRKRVVCWEVEIESVNSQQCSFPKMYLSSKFSTKLLNFNIYKSDLPHSLIILTKITDLEIPWWSSG